jgi:hypothetical protein
LPPFVVTGLSQSFRLCVNCLNCGASLTLFRLKLTCVPSSPPVARCLQIANCIRGGCSENGNPYFDGSASRLMQYRPNKK